MSANSTRPPGPGSASGGRDAAPDPLLELKGVGPARRRLLASLGINSPADALWHLPSRYEDRRFRTSPAEVPDGSPAALLATVESSRSFRSGGKIVFEAGLTSGGRPLKARWFNARGLSRSALFSPGSILALYGTLSRAAGSPVLSHPDVERAGEPSQSFGRIVPVYPTVEGLSQRVLRRIMAEAVAAALPEIRETFPPELSRRLGLPGRRESLETLHAPPEGVSPGEVGSPLSPWRRRLAFEELLLLQLGLRRRRMSEDRAGQVTAVRDGEMAVRLVKSLGFELTVAQRRVDGEIAADMAAGGSMRRLLQGDVGSGKTVIAALAVSRAVEAGFQAAMMAPTELLARQHAAVLGKMLSPLGIRTVLLAAGEEEAGRTKALEGLRDGSIAFAVGTHALIQESVVFDRLGLAVVDEQHRFGVRQRLALKQKGGSPDLLAMTATPIPRTLCLACYGDFDVSVLDELPPGRKPVATVIRREEERGAVLAEIKRELAAGRRVFVVFPAVDEDARGNLRAATAAARRLRREVSPGARVGLLHGRMDSRKRQGVMESFRRGETRLLVATTVIEVGVDVPEATLLVVEQAERFGLSQLHQLRGRVGRGDLPSQCVLMVSGEVGDEAMKRVRVAAEEGDGFRIAEADLALRGPGDFLGTRQSGIPALRVADLAAHGNLLPQAREEAAHLLARDADLAAPRHRELRLAANDLWKGKYHLAAAG